MTLPAIARWYGNSPKEPALQRDGTYAGHARGLASREEASPQLGMMAVLRHEPQKVLCAFTKKRTSSRS